MRTTYRNRKIFFPIKTVQILKETVPSSILFNTFVYMYLAVKSYYYMLREKKIQGKYACNVRNLFKI